MSERPPPCNFDWTPIECCLPVALGPVHYVCAVCGSPKLPHEVARDADGIAVCFAHETPYMRLAHAPLAG